MTEELNMLESARQVMTPGVRLMVLTTQLAQAALISTLLYLFSKVFKRDSLHYWCISWIGLTIYYLSLFIPRVIDSGQTALLLFSLIGEIAGLLSCLWLFLGARHFANLNVSRPVAWTISVAIFAIVVVFVTRAMSDPLINDYGAWMIRCLVGGCIYIASAWLLLTRVGHSSVGRTLLVVAFTLYGLSLLHYFVQTGSDWLDSIIIQSSIIDLALQALMGLGTIIWLLEREHEHVLETTRKIQQLACFDPVTRLPNRALFIENAAAMLRQSDSSDETLTMIIVNPDKFGRVNKVFGHMEGDEILRRVAGRLEAVLKARDSLARLEGDQFAVMTSTTTEQEALECSQRIIERMHEPFLINDSELYLTASLGAARYPQDGRTVENLLRCCQLSVDRAKQQGGDQLRYFEVDMSSVAIKSQNFETRFRQALSEDQFDLHYQPVRSLSNGQIVAVEALLRWNHPTEGLLPPGQFLREAERAGLSSNIVPWVLQQTCQRAASLHRVLPDLRMAVNIDAPTFQRPDFIELVTDALKRNRLRPEYLELELTETTAIREPDLGMSTIRRLRKLGVRVALDDFGTGFSSLGYLRDFPIDTLKIDRSFVQDLGQSSVAGAIVEAIITLAKRLRLTLVAEGVETGIQYKMLSDLGCDLAQGYLFSEPLPIDDLLAMIEKESDHTSVAAQP